MDPRFTGRFTLVIKIDLIHLLQGTMCIFKEILCTSLTFFKDSNQNLYKNSNFSPNSDSSEQLSCRSNLVNHM